MRLAALTAAVVGVGMIASASQAAISFSATRTALTGANAGLERVTLYGLSNNTGDLFGADVTVTVSQANGLKFRLNPAVTDPDTGDVITPESVVYTAANPTTATRTVANSIVFGTVAPGFPLPDPTTGKEAYRAGLPSWSIVGFDGRNAATTDVGVKAGADQNGGLGAAVLSAVVPTGTVVTFAGTAGDDLAGTPSYIVAVTSGGTPNVPEPATLSAMGLAALGLVRRRK